MFKQFKNEAGGGAMKSALSAPDLEDAAGQKRSRAGTRRVAKTNHFKGSSNAKKDRRSGELRREDKDRDSEVPTECPDRKNDFQGWLRYQKQKWRAFRKSRKEQRSALGGQANLPHYGVQAMLKRQEADALASNLHIVQTISTETPGEFVMWAMIGRRMYSIPLHVYRTLHVNQRKLDVDAEKGAQSSAI
jgi:DNA polymerase epsilon subunit 1